MFLNMKFYGRDTLINPPKKAFIVVLLFLFTAHCAVGVQRHTNILFNNNMTLIASPPSRESYPRWSLDMPGHPAFVEATTEVTSTPSVGTVCNLHLYLLPASSFLVFAVLL